MVEELIKIYISELSIRRILSKKLITINFLKTFLICVISLAVISVVYCIKSNPMITFIVVLAMIFFIVLFFLRDLNIEVKRIFKEHYQVKDFSELRSKRLMEYFVHKLIDMDEKKLDKFIKACEESISNNKVSFFIGRGFVIALFIALWTQSLSFFLNHYVVKLQTFILFNIIVAVLLLIFCLYISMLYPIINDIFNSRYEKSKLLVMDLKAYQLNEILTKRDKKTTERKIINIK